MFSKYFMWPLCCQFLRRNRGQPPLGLRSSVLLSRAIKLWVVYFAELDDGGRAENYERLQTVCSVKEKDSGHRKQDKEPAAAAAAVECSTHARKSRF